MTDLGIVVPDVPPPIHDCRNGHPQTPDNVYLHKQSQRFYCRVCRRLREQGRAVLNPRETVWTDETIAELRRGLDLKHSASWIADDIFRIHGWNVSRSAVCGKIFRLGLSNPMPQSRERKPRGPRKPSAWKPTPKPVPEPVPIVADDLIPFEQRRQIHELEDGMCKFPCGDPQERESFFFCGAQVVARSYCGSHYRRCYGGART